MCVTVRPGRHFNLYILQCRQNNEHDWVTPQPVWLECLWISGAIFQTLVDGGGGIVGQEENPWFKLDRAADQRSSGISVPGPSKLLYKAKWHPATLSKCSLVTISHHVPLVTDIIWIDRQNIFCIKPELQQFCWLTSESGCRLCECLSSLHFVVCVKTGQSVSQLTFTQLQGVTG